MISLVETRNISNDTEDASFHTERAEFERTASSGHYNDLRLSFQRTSDCLWLQEAELFHSEYLFHRSLRAIFKLRQRYVPAGRRLPNCHRRIVGCQQRRRKS
jgi:hypothetical protein